MIMAIAEDMKKLAENIITSHDVRVKALGSLVADTHKTLKGFERDRKKMAAEQVKDLADFVNGLSKNVSNMIKGFQKDHKAMADELEAGLEQGETQRLKDFQKMMADIQKAIKEIETFVANKLKEFDKAHADMSEELKKDLAKYVEGIFREVSSNMAQARKAWKGMSATMAKARKAGFMMPEIDAGEKVSTVKQATRKAQGKKRSAPKSSKQTVHAGV